MKAEAKREILFLLAAGLILFSVNAAVLMGVRVGLIGPSENSLLWGVLTALSVCSLLWAISLLGLHPMAVVFSYATGGCVAFYGAQSAVGLNAVDITTAGATCGAFGVLVAGNIANRVRKAFFIRQQAPFVYAIMALLLLDALVYSRAFHAGWPVIASAVVFPILLSFLIVGLVRIRPVRISAKGSGLKKVAGVSEKKVFSAQAVPSAPAAAASKVRLMIEVPEDADVECSMEDDAPEPAVEPAMEPECRAGDQNIIKEEESPEEAGPDNFFPVEIDKEEEVQLAENPDLLGVAAMLAESVSDPVSVEVNLFSEEKLPEALESEVSEESEMPAQDNHEQAESKDWLNGHIDLLSKLK